MADIALLSACGEWVHVKSSPVHNEAIGYANDYRNDNYAVQISWDRPMENGALFTYMGSGTKSHHCLKDNCTYCDEYAI